MLFVRLAGVPDHRGEERNQDDKPSEKTSTENPETYRES